MKQIFNFSNKTSSTLRTSLLSKTILTLLTALSFSGNAWAQKYVSGTWYSLYDTSDKSKSTAAGGTIATYSSIFPPASSTVTLDTYMTVYQVNSKIAGAKPGAYNINVGDAKISISESEAASAVRESVSGKYIKSYSYSYSWITNKNASGISSETTSVNVDYEYNIGNTLRTVHIKNVRIPLTKHIRLNNGSSTGKTSITKTFPNVAINNNSDPIPVNFWSFLTNGNITVKLTSGDKEVFRLGSTDNVSGEITSSKDGKTYSVGANACASANGETNANAQGSTLGDISKYGFNVYFRPKAATTYNGTITISDGTNSATVSLTGTGEKLTPEVVWSSNDEIFNEEDVLTATNVKDLPVTLSSTGNESYVNCDGNTATMLAATSGKITINAHVTGNDIYKDVDVEKQITITSLIKQHITWEQDSLAHLKLPATPTTITLDARASSNLPVTYTLYGDKTGLTLTKVSDTKWTLTYSTECKNTTIVATQGGNAEYAPASAVSLPIKVIDPTKECGTDETWIQTSTTMKDESKTQNIEVPSTMTIKLKRTKTGLLDFYINGFKVEFYTQKDAKGSAARTEKYSASQIGTSETTFDITDLDVSYKSVKITSEASNGYDVTSVTYTKQKYCNLSASSLSFTTNPNETTTDKTIKVSYANYPLSVTCSNPKFTFTPTDFGDCGEFGEQPISINYTAGEDEGDDVGYLYITDNTGNMQKTCTLNVAIAKIPQNITYTDIATSYKTTDRIELSAVANSNLTEFEYSATPEGIASFDGNVMTFSKSGTISITVTQSGSISYASASKTIENVVVSAVTPDIAEQPTATLICKGTFANDSLKGGLATVTLRNVADTHVDGHFEWVNANEDVTVEAGTHEYSVKFVPDDNSTDNGMYNDTTFSISVTVNRAQSAIEMNNGSVVAGASLDLSTLIASQTFADHTASYEVISGNADVQANIFTATELGEYIIRATKAETGFYTEATDEFTVTVVQGKTFNGTKSNEWNNPDKWTGGKPTDNDPVIINQDIAISDTVIIVGGLTIENGKTVTIKNGASLTVGNENSLARANNDHGNIIVEAGGKLNLGTGSVEVNNFTIYSGYVAGQTKSGQVLNANMLAVKDSARFILDITAGEIVAEEWYDITVPFPVNALTGITRYENGEWKSLTYDTHYAFMYYNEEARARGGKGWKWYRGTLKPGVAYSFITDATINRYCFTKTNDGNINTDLEHQLQASQGLGEDVYRGWNGIGNGTLTYVNLGGTNYVQMFDYEARTYQPVDVSMNTFAVGAAYFVQVTKDSTLTMNIDTEGNNLLRAPQRSAESVASNRFGVKLTNNGRKCDNFFVICDEDATDNYTIGTDLMKMGNLTGTKVARMWTNAKGTNLCAIHKAYNGNEAIIPLSIYAPANAEYTLSLDRNTADDVYLTRNGVIVWDLTMSEYTFDLNAGTDDTYALKVVRRISNTATGIDETTDNDNRGTNFAEKIIVDGQLFILRDGNLYDAQGRKVENR